MEKKTVTYKRNPIELSDFSPTGQDGKNMREKITGHMHSNKMIL